jgi:RNA polymerase sigma-70 factor (ECF subfamily)
MGVAESDIDDAIQEVFTVVYRRYDSYDPTRPLRPWVAGIAVNVAHRSRRQRPSQRLEQEPIEASSPEDIALDEERRNLLLRALEGLDEERRLAFVLFELQGHTVPEISEMLSVPVNTLYSRIHRARQQLADRVRELGGPR